MNKYAPILNTASGSKVTLKPDWFVLTDGTAKAVPSLLDGRALATADKVKVFIDHETPCGSETHADWQKQLIRFAVDQGCELFNGYGTSYQLMLEKHIKAGDVVAHCGDFGSIYGAAGAFAVKLSPEEMAAALVSGEAELAAAAPVHLKLSGSLQAPACAKDAAIAALPLLGDTTGKLVLVSGTGRLSDSERTAFFQLLSVSGCDDAIPEEDCGQPDVTLELGRVVPSVTGPGNFRNAKPAADMSGIAVTAVFIGGCSAGRIEDIRAAAAVIKGRRVQRKVRLTVAFASTDVYVQAANEGLITQLMDAGAVVMNQGCSACYAHSQGMVDAEDVVLSSGSRVCPNCNGEGDVPTYLCSAATAMESALTGVITPAGN